MALVIDEAQSLSLELLEEVRLLSNMETANTKLLPLVLAGQPELAARLDEQDLRQLKQRITVRCEIHPFELNETVVYLTGRIQAAGGNPMRLFTQEAILDIHERSAGIARTINVICDNAMISGMALGQPRLTRAIIRNVCRDLGLDGRSVKDSSPVQQTPENQTSVPAAEPAVFRRVEGEAAEGVASPESEAEAVRPRRFAFPFRSAATTLRTRMHGK
jgi:general secretion pathway protein A